MVPMAGLEPAVLFTGQFYRLVESPLSPHGDTSVWWHWLAYPLDAVTSLSPKAAMPREDAATMSDPNHQVPHTGVEPVTFWV